MIDYEDIISQLIERATTDENGNLHSAIPEFIKSNDASEESLNYLYRELESKYEIISRTKYISVREFNIQDEKWNDVINLISWCIRGMRVWTCSTRASINEITVILNITCFLDKEGCFWKFLKKSNITLSQPLIEQSQLTLSKLRCEFKLDETRNVPIHEEESLERFLSAISNKDWKEISDLWRMFNNNPLLHLEDRQRLLMLDYFEPSLLVSTFKDTNDIPILMHIMYELRVETAFLIGYETTNEYLEFASVHSTLNNPKGKALFKDTEVELLTSVLCKCMNDSKKFNTWMDIFNKYPPYYQNIQESLGEALAINASDENLDVYIKSIPLSNHGDNESRKVVSECLASFVRFANPNKRKVLWSFAYKYWKEWCFGEKESNNYMFNVSFSNLDFAIIGYYKEFISAEEKAEVKKVLVENMHSFENKWHSSFSAATTYWYRNLSFYQTIEHAYKATEEPDTWLLLGGYYIPEQFHENKYSEMLVR